MSYTPRRELLCGLPLKTAELYGKPHIGCHYERFDAKSHRRDEGARCAVCGRPATNAHHVPALSHGRSFNLRSPLGCFVLLPALVAVCGSGTTGCHGALHGRETEIEWVWDDDCYANAWWSGELLAHGYAANSPRLYQHGLWRITRGGEAMEVRL